MKLIIFTMVPSIATALFVFLNRRTSFIKLSSKTKQIIYGITFGLIAVLGTEFGIPINGAQINVRDGAVLTAGLLFGGQAGILAGLIGGVERFFAVYWGVGTYTRIACSVSTALAGFYAAFLKKNIFDNKRPSIGIACAIGVVMEVFHLLMIFITNMNDPYTAIKAVESCSFIMIVANALAIVLSTVVHSYFLKKNDHHVTKLPKISYTIQKWMLVCVVLLFFLTNGFVYGIQLSLNKTQISNLLSQAIKDVNNDVLYASDCNLLDISRKIKQEINDFSLEELAAKYDVDEINIINKKGIIADSTESHFIGMDMKKGEQSAAFLCLLEGQETFVQSYGPISYNQAISRKYVGIATNDGFIQVGYGATKFQRDLKNSIRSETLFRHVGQNGFVIIADADKKTVSAPNDKYMALLSDYVTELGEKNKIFTTYIDDQLYYGMYSISEGYYVVSFIPEEDLLTSFNTAIYSNGFLEVIAFAMVFALVYILIKKVVVDKLNDVNKSLANITNGDLEEVVNVRSNREFAYLSDDINSTVNTLKQYIADASARIDEELGYAKNIQYSSLAHNFPDSDRFEIYAVTEAAKEVGGDFYDFYRPSPDKLVFMIADVSGKGIPGAMFMMRAKSELRSLVESGIEMNEVFNKGNNRLCDGNDAGMFVTAWEGCIDLSTGLIKYANAGHNPPIIKRADGTCEFVRCKPGFVLAGMEDINYKLFELQMNKGDVLYLYTDGVVEANNVQHELYGDDRLLNFIASRDFVDPLDMCCEVFGSVGTFVDAAEQFDDITMLAFKYFG